MNEDKRTVENLRQERARDAAGTTKGRSMQTGQDAGREAGGESSSYRGEFAETINRGMEEGINLIDAKGLYDRLDQVAVLDLRSPEDFARDSSRIEGSLRFNPSSPETLVGFSRQTPYALVCGAWQESKCLDMARIMRQQGFQDVSVLRGGWEAWRQAGFPIERAEE